MCLLSLHPRQLNALLAAKDAAQMEKARVRDEAKAEVMAVKTKLGALSKLMDQRCTREVLVGKTKQNKNMVRINMKCDDSHTIETR